MATQAHLKDNEETDLEQTGEAKARRSPAIGLFAFVLIATPILIALFAILASTRGRPGEREATVGPGAASAPQATSGARTTNVNNR